MLTTKNSALHRSASSISTLIALLCMLILCACQPSGPRALLLGGKYVRQGDYPKALKYLTLATQLIPEKPQGWNLLGLAYHGQQLAPQAAQAYQRALQIDRKFAPAHFNLGVLLLEQQHVPEAISELNTYVGLAPNDPNGWEKLSTALIRARKFDEADRALQQALKLNPKSAEALNNLGLVQVYRKRPREGIQAFNAALQANPAYGAALLNQAIVAQQYFDNRELALERYRAYLTTKPDGKTAVQVRGIIDQIERELKPPQIAGPGPITNLASLPAPFRSNAVRTVETTPPARPTNPPPQTNIAAVIGASNATVPLTNPPAPPRTTVAAAAPTNAPAPGRTSVVTAVARELPKTNAPPAEPEPAAPEPAVPVEVVRVEKEPDFKAPSDVSQPVVTPANTTTAATNAASQKIENPPLLIPRRERKDEEKSGLLDKMNPAHWFKREEKPAPPSRASGPAPGRSTPSAAPQETKVAQAAPPPPPRVYPRYPYRNNISLPAGNRPAAEKFVLQGVAAHQQGRLNEAIEFYKKAIAADPSSFDAQYNLGLAAYQYKDLPLALAAYEQAVTLKPASVDARLNFATALRDANYFTDAANELRQLLAEAPNEARAHLVLANIYARQLDEPALARRHYQQVLVLAPNHPEAPYIRQWLAAQPQ